MNQLLKDMQRQPLEDLEQPSMEGSPRKIQDSRRMGWGSPLRNEPALEDWGSFWRTRDSPWRTQSSPRQTLAAHDTRGEGESLRKLQAAIGRTRAAFDGLIGKPLANLGSLWHLIDNLGQPLRDPG